MILAGSSRSMIRLKMVFDMLKNSLARVPFARTNGTALRGVPQRGTAALSAALSAVRYAPLRRADRDRVTPAEGSTAMRSGEWLTSFGCHKFSWRTFVLFHCLAHAPEQILRLCEIGRTHRVLIER